MSNIIRGNFRLKRRVKEDKENKVLRCEVSERWIQFPQATDLTANEVDYMRLEVMTKGNKDQDRKLCEVIVDRNMLLDLLKNTPVIDHRGTENE
jgi:hypothetical protein